MLQPRARVLVIDDDPLLARIMQRVLSGEFEVAVAHDGPAALALLAQGFYAAVITDVVLPGVSGLQLHGALRERDAAQARRVVFVTGGTWGEDSDEALAATGQPVLHKPFAFAALLEVVRQVTAAT